MFYIDLFDSFNFLIHKSSSTPGSLNVDVARCSKNEYNQEQIENLITDDVASQITPQLPQLPIIQSTIDSFRDEIHRREMDEMKVKLRMMDLEYF